jgi:hypothetical protein
MQQISFEYEDLEKNCEKYIKQLEGKRILYQENPYYSNSGYKNINFFGDEVPYGTEGTIGRGYFVEKDSCLSFRTPFDNGGVANYLWFPHDFIDMRVVNSPHYISWMKDFGGWYTFISPLPDFISLLGSNWWEDIWLDGLLEEENAS